MKRFSKHRSFLIVLIPLLLISFLLLSGLTVASGDEIVMFNIKSLKYHCPSCRWAIKCTKNCIRITKIEAIKRGGIPCKVCGGSC